MIEPQSKLDLHSKFFWKRVASVFTLIWIPLVIIYTQGKEDHWLSNTIFLVPLFVWGVILFIFRKSREEN
jgi:hypothetical protein